METSVLAKLLTENGPGVVLACVFGFLYIQERKSRIASDLELKKKLEEDIRVYRDIVMKAVPNGN